MNILLMVIEILLSYFFIMFFYKKYKQEGLYLWILLFSILIGIMPYKTVEIFHLELNLGFVINALFFIVANVLVQKKGPEEIKKVLSIIILSNTMLFTISVVSMLITESSINLKSNEAFNQIFNLNSRVYFSSIISLCISLYLNSILYHQIRQLKNKLWITNLLSTIIINLIECFLFCLITYVFKVSFINLIELIVIRYMFKFVISIISILLVYGLNKVES